LVLAVGLGEARREVSEIIPKIDVDMARDQLL